jgi:hypothetical protein
LSQNSRFTAADLGDLTYRGLVLRKKGKQTIAVKDTLDGAISGSVSIDVSYWVAQSRHGEGPRMRVCRQVSQPDLRRRRAYRELSAILLHTLPVRAQCHYNANHADGLSSTPAKSLKSTPIQHQSNVSQMADAPDSKSGPCQQVLAGGTG